MVLRVVASILVVGVAAGTCHGAFHISSPRAHPPPLLTRTGTRPCRVPSTVLFGGRDDGVDKGFNLLENASKVVPQGAIVATAKESWKFIWKRMMAELAPQDKSGSYARPKYSFNGKIGEDAAFPDEAGRYHVYLGNPCPWCHRVRLALALRSMDKSEIGFTILVDDPVKASRGGWVFGATDRDPLANCRDLREVYDALVPGFTGRCTAPLLVDLKGRKIVSNESSDIVRMLGKITLGDSSNKKERRELYPDSLVTQIEETNAWVYPLLNNGVYRCGFSTTQTAYDAASADVRKGLQQCQDILSQQPYLCGNSFTEADLRLLPTVLRFDGAYAPLFKAGGTHLRIRDYPALHAWLQRCWDLDGVKETIDLADANASYYKQLFPLNPGGIIPSPVTAEQLGLS
eukprot:CAMPEP_0198287796 /NCGR_PEP_ID=MMETSP1449-20131203/6495_1 /TAXON_ID=420275 /ORGANISM="Attheya septentrionalis, Strain CCMP2084" /LENGTH=401 /DNA_ID=CAMNT_0043985817 /DNA_START=245 /DNA_END=1450 /DNA_ORIENTATION=-